MGLCTWLRLTKPRARLLTTKLRQKRKTDGEEKFKCFKLLFLRTSTVLHSAGVPLLNRHGGDFPFPGKEGETGSDGGLPSASPMSIPSEGCSHPTFIIRPMNSAALT